jgi:hypothetical protein
MANRKLGEKEIDQLLTNYRSERRQLSFRLELVRTALRDLKKAKAKLPKSAPKPSTITLPDGTVKRRPGRPRKGEVVVKQKKKPGRKPKRVRAPRELNPWDTMVMNTIRSTGRLLPKQEILQQAYKWASVNEPSMKKPQVEVFLTRTLQKLAGRKGMLGMHHTGLGRGNHYGLKEWFFASSGKLRSSHLDKLVLTKG